MNLYIRRLIDEAHTIHPELGSRRIGLWLKQQHSLNINRKAVQRHMREMEIEAVYPRPDASKPNPEHKIYPYLLKNLDITRPNQVWSIDVTYIPNQQSFLYLVSIIYSSSTWASWFFACLRSLLFSLLNSCGRLLIASLFQRVILTSEKIYQA